MAVRFAKMDADLDSHPKVRKAGRVGREVFLFVLRRNAALDRSGRVPATYVEPWYLADQLMMSEDEACHGLSRTVTAGLLSLDDGHVSICGWSDEWAKAPLDEAERKRREREKKKAAEAASTVTDTSVDESRDVTDSHGHAVTDRDCPDSHALDKKRGEEKRREESRSLVALPPAPPPAEKPKADRSALRRPMPADWMPGRTDANIRAEATARTRGVDLALELTKARDWASSNAAKKADWDGFWRNWTRNAKPVAGQTNLDKQFDRIRMLREQEAAEDAAKGEP